MEGGGGGGGGGEVGGWGRDKDKARQRINHNTQRGGKRERWKRDAGEEGKRYAIFHWMLGWALEESQRRSWSKKKQPKMPKNIASIFKVWLMPAQNRWRWNHSKESFPTTDEECLKRSSRTNWIGSHLSHVKTIPPIFRFLVLQPIGNRPEIPTAESQSEMEKVAQERVREPRRVRRVRRVKGVKGAVGGEGRKWFWPDMKPETPNRGSGWILCWLLAVRNIYLVDCDDVQPASIDRTLLFFFSSSSFFSPSPSSFFFFSVSLCLCLSLSLPGGGGQPLPPMSAAWRRVVSLRRRRCCCCRHPQKLSIDARWVESNATN